MYCLNCRHVTETGNSTNASSKNGRLMRRGQYVTCRKTKTQFVKRVAAAGSFLNTLVNKVPFAMHLPGYIVTGTGTKLYKRLNTDGTPKEWSMPSIDLTTQLIITMYAIENMMILKLGLRFMIRQCLVS